MALLWLDGFDKFTVDADLAKRGYATSENAHFLATGGRDGTGSLQVDGSANTDFNVPLNIAGGAAFHTAAWYYFPGGRPVAFMRWFNADRSENAGLQCVGGGNGTLQAIYWDGAGNGNSAAGTINQDQWHHIETYTKFDEAGFFKVYVDNALVIDLSGDTTSGGIVGPGPVVAWMAFLKSDTVAPIIDDLVIWDDIGTDFAPAQLGKHKIETLSPIGAGAHADFVPAIGNNYQNIDDPGGHDADLSYNEGETVGLIDTFDLSDLSAPPQGIHGIQVVNYGKYVDTPCGMKPVIRSGTGDEVKGKETPLGPDYVPVTDFFTKDPTSNSPFTQADVDALEAGYNKSS